MRLAIDLANYTPVPTPPQLQCLKDAGYGRAIVGCSYGTVADLQIAAFYASGFEVEAYAWVSFGASWQGPIDRCLAVVERRRYVRRVWLDCEEEVAGMTGAQYEARISACVDYVRQKRPEIEVGIYTGRWWWLKHLPACTRFASLPLFAAQYVADPSAPPSAGLLLFGGWTEATIWQYAGSVETCGLNVDRCVILEEEHMPTAEYEELRQLIGNTLGYAVESHKALDAIGQALAAHIQGGTDTVPDLDALRAALDALKARVDAAGAALNP